MKKTTLLFALFSIAFSYAQVKFENGYIITNDNQRIEVLIKNTDLKNNPSTLEYKTGENTLPKTGTVDDVKAFEIYNQAKYLVANVNLDRSGVTINNLSIVREPIFKLEKLFLKEIVKGEASLYQYSNGNLNRFFSNSKDGEMEQLIYKPYMIEENKVAYNNDYKTQLKEILICATITDLDIEKMSYLQKDMVDLFVKYNICKNPDFVQVSKKSKKGQFKVNVRPRLNFISAEINNPANQYDAEFGLKTTFGAGLELEYILPFNRNKWALVVESAYQSYQSEIEKQVGVYGGKRTNSVSFKSVQIPLGLRHYFYLNDEARLFINGQWILNIPIEGINETTRLNGDVFNTSTFTAKPNYAFGVGYSFKNKYGAEFRYFTNSKFSGDLEDTNSSLKAFSLILSYTLF